MSDHGSFDQETRNDRSDEPSLKIGTDPLELIEQCLATFSDGDPRQKLLYKLRHAVMLSQTASQQREVEFKKVSEVVAKLTAPANRIGTLLEIPAPGLARIVVGGAEYYANVDPRVANDDLRIGTQILVNEAYAVIRTLGYDRNGPILKLAETLPDGRLRFEQDMGRQSLILQRSTDLVGADLKAGDHIRIDPSLRVALEKLVDQKAGRHVLDEAPKPKVQRKSTEVVTRGHRILIDQPGPDQADQITMRLGGRHVGCGGNVFQHHRALAVCHRAQNAHADLQRLDAVFSFQFLTHACFLNSIIQNKFYTKSKYQRKTLSYVKPARLLH